MMRSILPFASLLALVACDPPAPPPAPEPAPQPPHAIAPTPPPAPPASPLGEVPIPADNPQTAEKVALGHQLFFDKRLSSDGSRSCYTCHQNEDGNGGHEPLAIGAGDKQLTRHSPVIWNVGYLPAHYWDGRAPTLESQATAAWAGGNMGVGKDNLQAKAEEIGAIPGYKESFEKVFPGEGATPQTIVQAIAAYERTLVCDNTAWDRAQKGDQTALSETQKQGQTLFMGKGGCVACHAPPFFSTAYQGPSGVYFNVGIGTKDIDEASVDIGRAAVTKADGDWAAFKVPSLRNISKSAPYFHDGSVATLEGAVRLMASGGLPNKNLTPLMTDKQLSDDEIAAVVAFLGALDCEQTLQAPTLP